MRIELLYFDDCPSYRVARTMLEQVLAEQELDATIELIRVVDDADAVSKHFVGSPTLRIIGADLFPDQTSDVYALQCRMYRTPDGFRGAPSQEMLAAALRRHFP